MEADRSPDEKSKSKSGSTTDKHNTRTSRYKSHMRHLKNLHKKSDLDTERFAKKMHVKYFQRLLQIMPSDLVEFDSTRLMIVYFAFSGLDLLHSLDEISEEAKLQAIDWIYGLQVRGAGSRSGFQASTTIPKEVAEYQYGHLAMTYTGLVTLLILGDDLSRVDRESIIEGLRACQNPDGSFTGMVIGCESDMRFLYCACCVSKILNDWSGVDIPRATDYIIQSIVSIFLSIIYWLSMLSAQNRVSLYFNNCSRLMVVLGKDQVSSLMEDLLSVL